MRGKADVPVGIGTRIGITPAYAGKSCWNCPAASRRWDHPRVCGEKLHAFLYAPCNIGSPPRMRGKEPLDAGRIRASRITPAYAGKSKYTARKGIRFWDHPRVCGEKAPWGWIATLLPGSPPRMRGKTTWLCTAKGKYGITPADAGKSHCPGWTVLSPRDHPRVCGEKAYSNVMPGSL